MYPVPYVPKRPLCTQKFFQTYLGQLVPITVHDLKLSHFFQKTSKKCDNLRTFTQTVSYLVSYLLNKTKKKEKKCDNLECDNFSLKLQEINNIFLKNNF